jgi:hypothetical protein
MSLSLPTFRPCFSAVSRAAIILAFAASAARAELQVVEEQTDEGQLTTYKMTVTPAAEPTPAMKYRLLPTPFDLRPGNAALHYTRAFADNGVNSVWKSVTDEYGFDVVHGDDKSNGWYSIEAPLAELPLDKVRAAAAKFDTLVKEFVARGTVRRDCDWGHNIEELRGAEIFETLLPEVQETRSLSRALMLRARVAVADGDFDRAIDELRMNYRLAQNVAQAPFLVSGLVGLAEASMGNAEVVELIAAKDSPNLYWALAALPRPFIDLQPSVQFELGNTARVIPFLLNPEQEDHSPQEWARLLAQGLTEMQTLGAGGPKQPEWVMRAGVAGLSLVAYPDAKRRLIDGGMDPERVAQMPVGQVIAIDASRECRRVTDEFEKGWYVPFRENKAHDAKAAQLVSGGKLEGGYGRMVASLMLPALSSVRTAQMRLGWQMNALQTVEAIRMHAAQTGALPASLDEIEIVPVPDNPVTEKPYEYRLDGDTAVLELPFSDGMRSAAWRFEIKLAE